MAMLVAPEVEQVLIIQVAVVEALVESDKVQQTHLPQAEMVAQV
jgi:hypothetical protein